MAEWRCVVFDDCPDGSAKSIVEEMRDRRFEYRKNASPLGAIGNIDQCFRREPYVDGAFACVLEDDNYLLPNHLQAQLETCRRERVTVTFSAQYVEAVVSPDTPGRLTQDKTIAWIYPEGRRTWREMLPAVLFSHAFSNGSVFWGVDCRSDFEIGALTARPGIQETLRILRLRDDAFVSHLPTSVWRSNDPRDSYVSPQGGKGLLDGIKRQWRWLTERRAMNDCQVWYMDRFGLDEAMAFANLITTNRVAAMERSILLAGRHVVLTEKPASWRRLQLAKGYAFRATVVRQLDMRRFDDIPSYQ
jgi:hypothetical protein